MSGGKPYDLVVFGATGVTGRQVARSLAHRSRKGLPFRWAIASRSRSRLETIGRDLPPEVGVLVADVRDQPSIDDLVANTRVVLNMAGPYALFGEPLVRACAREGVHYVDVSAETAHVRRLIDRYHDEAARTGAKIVPFCGFDSVPSDIGTLLLVEHFRARGLATRGVKGFMRASARLNPGTVATTLELWRRQEDLKAMQDPLLLNPEAYRGSDERLRNPDPVLPSFDPDLGRWVAPFFMGPINTRVVRRSRALSAEWEADYGRGFAYQEYWDPGGPASWLPAVAMSWGLASYRMMSVTPGADCLFTAQATREQVGSEDALEGHCYFRALFLGIAMDGSRAWAEISGRGDPSNGVTATIACECALALAFDQPRLPGGAARAGVLTPATAIGLALADRLRASGIRVACPVRPS
jgi:short subunit dehydrogenase-like uncharacterized protein